VLKQLKRLKPAWQVLEWVIFVALFLLLLLTISPALPFSNIPRTYIVVSASMEPTITTGSLAFTTPAKPDQVKVGDIIAFTSPSNPKETILHRVIQIKENNPLRLKTKGDNNNTPDNWDITAGAILAKEIFTIPYLGHVGAFIRKPHGFALVIGIPALFIIMVQFLNIKKAISDEVERQLNEKLLKIKPKKRLHKKTSPPTTAIILLLTVLIGSLGQIPTANALFMDKVTVSGLNLSVKDFVPPPVPLLISPGSDSALNLPTPIFDWSDVVDYQNMHNPVYYLFEMSATSDFSLLTYQSSPLSVSQISTPGLPEGTYWWHVRACDTLANCSPFSNSWKVTIDRHAPDVYLFIPNSWSKQITENITNGGFETGDLTGWTSAGNVNVLSLDSIATPTATVLPSQGNYLARIGDTEDPGNLAWENRLMQSFTGGIKNISLDYNFYSRDFTPFDNPGFYVRINGQEVYRLNTLDVNPTDDDQSLAQSTGWQQFYYDLSDITTQNINLAIYAGNNPDNQTQSWAYVDNVTTFVAAASANIQYSLIASDVSPSSGIDHCNYQIDGNAWQEGDTFIIATPGQHTINYYCIDNAGNSSLQKTTTVITDSQAPSTVDTLSSSGSTPNSITLTWQAPADDGNTRTSKYDLHFAPTNFPGTCSDFNFDTAFVFDHLPSPQKPGNTETIQVIGLNPNTSYCFALKSADAAPNWSAQSNLVSDTTFTGDLVNPGDVVINEIMWQGTSASPEDQYVELRNLTDRTLNLSGWKIKDLFTDQQITIGSGSSLAPHGLFLIANKNLFDLNPTVLKVIPDFWSNAIFINTPQLFLALSDDADQEIDRAWDGTLPTEGYFDPVGHRYYSLERTTNPGDGTNPLNWYTCIDQPSHSDFFLGDSDERGTPGAPNRSENEPFPSFSPTQISTSTPTIVVTPAPQVQRDPAPQDTATSSSPLVDFYFQKNKAAVGFLVSNFSDYQQLTYIISYQTNGKSEGITGNIALNGTSEVKREDLILGTCSSGGTCIYHSGITSIDLTIILSKGDEQTLITKQLSI